MDIPLTFLEYFGLNNLFFLFLEFILTFYKQFKTQKIITKFHFLIKLVLILNYLFDFYRRIYKENYVKCFMLD